MGKALQGYLADFLDDNPAPELYKTQRQIDRIHEIHHNDVFDVEEPLCYDIYKIKRTITLLDDRKPSVINSPQVQTYYNFLMDNRTADNRVILWNQKREFAEAI